MDKRTLPCVGHSLVSEADSRHVGGLTSTQLADARGWVQSTSVQGLTNTQIEGLGRSFVEAMSFTPSEKPSNPKDAVGIKKVPLSTVPSEVLMEIGLAMLEGALKYGRHNYRAVGVRSSVYYDAAMRHLTDWWEGTDIDPDSGLSHVTKAIATLVVLRDSMIMENITDDRPPKLKEGWLQNLNKIAGDIIDKYPNPKKAFTEK